jgi:hypothetical protein
MKKIRNLAELKKNPEIQKSRESRHTAVRRKSRSPLQDLCRNQASDCSGIHD